MSDKLTVTEINVSDDVQEIREMNDVEWAKYLATQDAIKLAAEQKEKDAAAKAALLNKLGITEEEARLLLG
jgi:hypothetical protein